MDSFFLLSTKQSPTDEILLVSSLLVIDAGKTNEGTNILHELYNMRPLETLDRGKDGGGGGSGGANGHGHFGTRAEQKLNDLCDLLDRHLVCDVQVSDDSTVRTSLTHECHAMLTPHIRRFGLTGFHEIITNVLSHTVS